MLSDRLARNLSENEEIVKQKWLDTRGEVEAWWDDAMKNVFDKSRASPAARSSDKDNGVQTYVDLFGAEFGQVRINLRSMIAWLTYAQKLFGGKKDGKGRAGSVDYDDASTAGDESGGGSGYASA